MNCYLILHQKATNKMFLGDTFAAKYIKLEVSASDQPLPIVYAGNVWLVM